MSIQYRGVCPECFKNHATSGGYMVDHGYTIWWGRNNSCNGVDKPHYNSVAGLEYCKQRLVDFKKQVAKYSKSTTKPITYMDSKGEKITVPNSETVAAYTNAADVMQSKINSWVERDLQEVHKEITASERIVHLKAQWFSASLTAPVCVRTQGRAKQKQYSVMTWDAAEVTCKCCLAAADEYKAFCRKRQLNEFNRLDRMMNTQGCYPCHRDVQRWTYLNTYINKETGAIKAPISWKEFFEGGAK